MATLAASSAAGVIGGVLGVIVLWLLPALLVARLARRKGRTFGLWLAVALLLPGIGLIVAALFLMQQPDTAETLTA
jgi:hypothetical protein